MKREIKFRAWDGEKMHWLDYLWNDNWYNAPTGGQATLENRNTPCQRLFQSGNLQLMQFTGLTDKNGNEIYEGDIVKLGADPEGKFPRQINWYRHGFWCSQIGCENKYPITFCFENETDWEIIGNIYENPELVLAVAGSDLKPISSGGILP